MYCVPLQFTFSFPARETAPKILLYNIHRKWQNKKMKKENEGVETNKYKYKD